MGNRDDIRIGTLETVDDTDTEQAYFAKNGCSYRVYISHRHGWEYFTSKLSAESVAANPIYDIGTIESLNGEEGELRYFTERGCTYRVRDARDWQYVRSESVARSLAERLKREAAAQNEAASEDRAHDSVPSSWRREQIAALKVFADGLRLFADACESFEEAQRLAHPTIDDSYWVIDNLRLKANALLHGESYRRAREQVEEIGGEST